MPAKVIKADCIDYMKFLGDNSIDAIVTDPPYEIGFAGKKWDKTGIAYNTEVWKQCLRVLKPGGHLLAFSATRTSHRIAIAIENSGLEIRDNIAWLYGEGMPIGLDIGKAVDKKIGNERAVVGKTRRGYTSEDQPVGYKNVSGNNIPITKGESDFEGWNTNLKPAFEPIIAARKPIEGIVVDNAIKYGTGGLNVDACRLPIEGEKSLSRPTTITMGNVTGFVGLGGGTEDARGRYPANVIVDEEAQKTIEEQTDTDGVKSKARFFYCAKSSRTERHQGLPKDKDYPNSHPTVKPITLMRYLCKLVTPVGGTILDPFTGSGSTGCAAVLEGFDFIGVELEAEYVDIARKRIEYWSTQVDNTLFPLD